MTATPDPTDDLIELRFVIQPCFDGWRLDRYLRARIPRLSRNRIQRLIRSQAALGGPTLRPASRVRAGQRLALLRPAPDEPEVPREFSILYQDDDLVALDKPAGLPVHATARFHRNTLTALLRERFPPPHQPALAHRLDRETSGILLVGLRPAASAALKRAFRQREVQKRYLAIVHGSPPPEGLVDLPLGPDLHSGIRIKMAVTEGGHPSRSRYRTLERRGAFSLLEVHPETGRQHQIRAHLCAIGHPVVGDKLYGQEPEVWLEYIASGLTERLAAHLLLPRQALHAAAIGFPHPGSAVSMELRCPLAPDLLRFWNGLTLAAGDDR